MKTPQEIIAQLKENMYYNARIADKFEAMAGDSRAREQELAEVMEAYAKEHNIDPYEVTEF